MVFMGHEPGTDRELVTKVNRAFTVTTRPGNAIIRTSVPPFTWWRGLKAREYLERYFEERVADISVDHAPVVEHYRTAHAVALASERGETTTEDLRQAITHYRVLFEDLLEVLVGEERRAIHAHELLALCVGPPVRARDAGELHVGEPARARHVRAAAQVDEVAVAEDGDVLALGDVAQARDLERFAQRFDSASCGR